MRYRLSPGSCTNLHNCAKIDMAPFDGMGLPDAGDAAFITDLDDVAERALNGEMPDLTGRWAGDGASSLDAILTELMAHMGIDVAAVEHFAGICASWLEIWTAEGPTDTVCRLRTARGGEDYVRIPRLGRWVGSETPSLLITELLPATIMPYTLVGRRLADIVDHPVLNRFPLTVSSASAMPFDGGIQLEFAA